MKHAEQSQFVTCGGPWSNHLLAAASVAHQFGFESTGLVRGNYHQFKNPILVRCQALGMKLLFLSNDDFSLLLKQPIVVLKKFNLSQFVFIPFGGDDSWGVAGCKAIVDEVQASGYAPTKWLVAAGTGTTAKGILGHLTNTSHVDIYSAVSQPIAIYELKLKLASYHTSCAWQLASPHRCGFGRVDEALIQFISDFYDQTDVLLDPLYNGKMLETFITHRLDEDELILAYHSGGLAGWHGIRHRYPNRFNLRFLAQSDLPL